MSKVTIETTITRQYLRNKTKDEIIEHVMRLLNENDVLMARLQVPTEYTIQESQKHFGEDVYTFKSEGGKWGYSWSDGENFKGPYDSQEQMEIHVSAHAFEIASDRASDACT